MMSIDGTMKFIKEKKPSWIGENTSKNDIKTIKDNKETSKDEKKTTKDRILTFDG